MAKTKKSKPNFSSSLALIFVGSILMGLSLAHNLLRWRALSLDRQIVSEYQTESNVSLPLPTHITIPWYVDVDITEELYHDGSWKVSSTTASYLLNSARPGEAGNTIIYGHNLRSILGNIRALQGGETITLTLSDGQTLNYRVTKLVQVKTNDTRYLQPTTEPTLTLFTCAGILDSERFIVQAVPVVSQ